MSVTEPISQAVIETERLVLRPITRADAGQLKLYGSDKRVAEATATIPHPLPDGVVEAFIERALNPERSSDIWVIDPSDDGSQMLGAIAMERMDRDQSEISYWVVPAAWNNGFASEAVTAMVEANPQACRTIFGSVFQDNPASARVLTNAGFEYIGDAESYSVARDATVPTWTYIKRLD
ncbi:RimJ/RimL family protein N-acetyltransferase [Litoreibacter ponti]|uniref:RimJ/RimL family protein N-acetyltransferase n=1 Tax=Litoreibacter ponti TaxID=1510457 RepID=A0A2T6BIZ4_9RHOB|nr:GNAT family N-acetyltransferase [Litoreibacter ponti]PTX56022.1 RimJ/RimL family protein N-acetyltransferase [Litoreibacter ponti]